MNNKLETIERWFRLIRELILMVVVGVLAFNFMPYFPELASQFKTASVTDVEFLGMKIKLQQAEEKIKKALKAQAPQEGKEDEGRIDPKTMLVAEALQVVQTPNTETLPNRLSQQLAAKALPVRKEPFWVYLGAQRGNTWLTQNFNNIQSLPGTGTLISANTDVFKRSNKPVVRDGHWYLGEVLGVLQSGDDVKVIRTESIPGTESRKLWWAEVSIQ